MGLAPPAPVIESVMSEKEKKQSLKKKNIIEYKSSSEFRELLKAIPDIELIDINKKND